jgi:alpha-mannosidase
MNLRRVSLILPSPGLDDFPSHLVGKQAAELLSAWTTLWHPALMAATGRLPGWHPADEPPDPSEFDGELVLVPSASRERLATDWCDRLRATSPRNPPPVEAVASRDQTLAATLDAAGLGSAQVSPDYAADFFALGHAHLQVELLTRAMRYTSVLDTEQFTNAAVAAARAAVDSDHDLAQTELARAFDLLSDARNHVYAVDFYVIDVTLLAASTLGQSLHSKLSANSPMNLLLTGELLDRMALEHPESLLALRQAIGAGNACPIGGMFHGEQSVFASPESLLAELESGQNAAQRHLNCDFAVYAQFHSALSPRLPELLHGMGFAGALHAAFDGGRLPKADQCKTWWGPGNDAAIQALATTPLDVARPETWLRLAERIGDSIAHDHVATILLAGWPGSDCDYYDDLRRAARHSTVMGKLITLDEYFRISREPDEWTSFFPREYRAATVAVSVPNPISSPAADYRREVVRVHDQLAQGIAAAAGLTISDAAYSASGHSIAINPWNFPRPLFIGGDLLADDTSPTSPRATDESPLVISNVPGCGFATLASAAAAPSTPMASNRTLRNEQLELTVSETTGGIQSLRTHRDRRTRISQRLVVHDRSDAEPTQMVAEHIDVTRNDSVMGEITSVGRLQNSAGLLLARFRQTVRLARDTAAAIVDVQLDPQRLPSGDTWNSYVASRLAWGDDAIAFRRGMQWVGREIDRPHIESPEWVEIDDGIGTITCFGLGLPYHRQAGPTWLDTLLLADGESSRRFQFALGIDGSHPTQTAVALVSAGRGCYANLPAPLNSETGWFLHLSARNLLLTHAESLAAPQHGIRIRVLETAGRDTLAALAAFRPIRAARTTDFRGQPTGVLSVSEGRAEFDIGPHRWIQLEAEW